MPNKFDIQNIRQSRAPQPTLNDIMKDITGSTPEPEIVEVEKIIEVLPDNALVKHEDGTFTYKRFVMTLTSMEMPDGMTREEWMDVGYIIKSFEDSLSWWIGDWAAVANAEWDVPYAQIAEAFGYEEDTVKTYASICRNVKRLIRNQPLSFSHHREVASLEPELQEMWLKYGLLFQFTVAAFKREMDVIASMGTGLQIQWVQWAIENHAQLSLVDELKPPKKTIQLVLPGFSDPDVYRRVRRTAGRIENWQAGKIKIEPAVALQEIDEVIQYWTEQREALASQLPARDNNSYQEHE